MKTKTSSVAEALRLKQWSKQIRDCQNRPAGQTMDDWCQQQGITKTNYYYRLRRVRQAILCYSEKENPSCRPAQDFVELPAPSANIPSERTLRHSAPEIPVASAVIRGSHGISIEIFSGTSPEMLHTLMRALAHAE